MAPEYALDGLFSAKSDIFSFGVLVLEILSGQRNNGTFNGIIGERLTSLVSIGYGQLCLSVMANIVTKFA